MSLLLKCPKCKKYSLKEVCECGEKTESPQYKFKPKWAKKEMIASFESEE